MKLQSFFCLEFFQVSTKLNFPYLSPHLLEWNESELPMSIKNLDNRVIRKVTHKTPVCILEEESEHQTFLCTKRRLKKIWTGV